MVTKKKTSKKKTRRKVAGRTAVKRRTPGWIILLSGMLFGLLIAGLVYVKGWVPKPALEKNIPVAQEKVSNNTSIEDKSAELSIEPKKNFDFYETLQDMEVVIDEKDIKQTDKRVPKSYIIQLGAFKNIKDAEALKAQVAFIGYTAEIQSFTDVNQTQWHRVRLGPYKSGRTADVIKRKMESNGFNANILREKI
jgi:cell division protein FtsN